MNRNMDQEQHQGLREGQLCGFCFFQASIAVSITFTTLYRAVAVKGEGTRGGGECEDTNLRVAPRHIRVLPCGDL